MKKLLLLLLIPFLVSCGNLVDNLMSREGIDDPSKAWLWVSKNIKGVAEPEGCDYWQSAELTIYKRTGDCEDMAILLGEMLYRLGVSSEMYVIMLPEQPHAVLNIYGVVIEPGSYDMCYLRVLLLAKYPYEEYRALSLKGVNLAGILYYE